MLLPDTWAALGEVVATHCMTDRDSEMDALAAEMEAAGLITIITRPDGGIAYQLTPEGERMAQQLAMSGDDTDLEKLLGHE